MPRHHSILTGIGFYVWTNGNGRDRADVVAFGHIVVSWAPRKLDLAHKTGYNRMPYTEEFGQRRIRLRGESSIVNTKKTAT